MKRPVTAALIAGVSLPVLVLLAGCATPGPRSRYLAELAPASITNLMAYHAGNSIEIRYPLKGTRCLCPRHLAAGVGRRRRLSVRVCVAHL